MVSVKDKFSRVERNLVTLIIIKDYDKPLPLYLAVVLHWASLPVKETMRNNAPT